MQRPPHDESARGLGARLRSLLRGAGLRLPPAQPRFERYTDRARRVMELANGHATRLYHQQIGPGHMLAGLLDEGSGVGVHVLRMLDVDPDLARAEVISALGSGRPMVTIGRLPMDAAANRVVAYAIEESALLGHTHVGTEHLLLGLLRERDSEEATALAAVKVTLQQARAGVRAAIQDASNTGWTAEGASSHAGTPVRHSNPPFCSPTGGSPAANRVDNPPS